VVVFFVHGEERRVSVAGDPSSSPHRHIILPVIFILLLF
jgi:hypothetical protein